MIFYYFIYSFAANRAVRPYPGSEVVISVPYGVEPANVCSMYGLSLARGNRKNVKALSKLLRNAGASEAYLGSFESFPNGVIISSRGKVRPYDIKRNTTEYAICSQLYTKPSYRTKDKKPKKKRSKGTNRLYKKITRAKNTVLPLKLSKTKHKKSNVVRSNK